MCKCEKCQCRRSLPDMVAEIGEVQIESLVLIVLIFLGLFGITFAIWSDVDDKLNAIHYCQKSLVEEKPN